MAGRSFSSRKAFSEICGLAASRGVFSGAARLSASSAAVSQAAGSLLPLGERRALPVQQLRLLLRLADLDAAQTQQRLHQRLAVALQGDELETLHFCDGHAIFPPPF